MSELELVAVSMNKSWRTVLKEDLSFNYITNYVNYVEISKP